MQFGSSHVTLYDRRCTTSCPRNNLLEPAVYETLTLLCDFLHWSLVEKNNCSIELMEDHLPPNCRNHVYEFQLCTPWFVRTNGCTDCVISKCHHNQDRMILHWPRRFSCNKSRPHRTKSLYAFTCTAAYTPCLYAWRTDHSGLACTACPLYGFGSDFLWARPLVVQCSSCGRTVCSSPPVVRISIGSVLPPYEILFTWPYENLDNCTICARVVRISSCVVLMFLSNPYDFNDKTVWWVLHHFPFFFFN